MKLRLDKFICDMTDASRSEIKNNIKKGFVSVNGDIIKKPEVKVDTETDEVIYIDEILSYEKYVYYMFHKPAGCVSATSDGRCKTVIDYFADAKGKDIFPVGRLDKDTEGLLIVTNDGELAHNLLAPKKHVEKTYYAEIAGRLPSDAIKQFEEGLDIGDEKKTLPAKLEIFVDSNVNISGINESLAVKVTITEGRYHQVKRMFEAVGCKVVYLKRLSMGRLMLDEKLEKGEWRVLNKDEVDSLRRGMS